MRYKHEVEYVDGVPLDRFATGGRVGVARQIIEELFDHDYPESRCPICNKNMTYWNTYPDAGEDNVRSPFDWLDGPNL